MVKTGWWNSYAKDTHTHEGGGGGPSPSDTIETETAYGQVSGAGVGTLYSRGDHTHGTPAVPSHGSLGGIGPGDHHAQLHAAAHQPGGGDAMAVDAVTGTGSLRTLGTGVQQAAAGDHSHAGGGANVKSGMVSVADGGTATVTFTTAFASTPRVSVSLEGATAATDIAQLTEPPTTTGFTVRVQKGHTGGGHTWTVHWIATDAGNP